MTTNRTRPTMQPLAAATHPDHDNDDDDQHSDAMDEMDVDQRASDNDSDNDEDGDDEQQGETSTGRRSSARLRSRPSRVAVTTPKAKTIPATAAKAKTKTPAKRGRKLKATAVDEASHSDQDENKSLSDDDNDNADDDNGDDDDDDDDHRPAKRSSRRSAAAAAAKPASKKGAATATFKKPALPASRSAKKSTSAAETGGGRRKRGTVVRLDLDNTGLWDAVTTTNVAMSGIVKQWLTEYHVRPSDALLAVVNMLIAATGCTETISPARFEDQDAVPDYVEELQAHMTSADSATTGTGTGTGYPLISRTKTHKLHMQAFFSFFTHLIASDDDALWDDVLLQVVQQWLAAMVSSPLRAFRHTATALGLHLASTLCTPLANDKHAYHDQVVDTHAALYDTIFVHRYRDVDPNIRKECMRALATWVERVPDRFLDPTYLRYFGWLLNDQDAGVRTVVLECLAHLYANAALVPGLRLFTERFKARMLEIASADVDPGVQRAGVVLVCLVYQMGVLSADEVDAVCALVFAKHIAGAAGGHAPNALVGVWKEETEPMDWPRLVEWIAGLIGAVYPDAQVSVTVDKRGRNKDNGGESGSDTDDGDDAMGVSIPSTKRAEAITTVDPLKCDYALGVLIASVPTLPLFASPEPALARLRRTDTSLPHEHLLLALVCALAQHARDSVGRTLTPHLPALLAKYKADDVALVYLFRAARAGVPTDAWTAAAATLDGVLAAGVAAFKRDALPVVLDEVARLVGALSARSETSVLVGPFVRKLVTEGCGSERPATLAAVVKVVKMPEDVLLGEVKPMVDAIEVGTVERVFARFMVAVQQVSLSVSHKEEKDKEGEEQDGDEKKKTQVLAPLAADLRHDVEDTIQECVDMLCDPDVYSARTRVAAANVLMECASVFDGIDLDDRALALLEQLIAARMKSLIMADGQEDLAPQTDARANPTLAFLESDQALVRMFAKLVGVGAIDAAYAPTVLQFYRRPPVPASERDDAAGTAASPWSVDELARQLTQQADRVVMGEVLEKVPEATLVQVCLSAVQRAFRLSEADKELGVASAEKYEDGGKHHEVEGEPDRPGAVPRLAKSLAEVFKRRKTANVKPVIAYGAQWVVEQFEPTDLPERPVPKEKTKKAKKKKKPTEKPEGDDDDAMDVDQRSGVFAASDAEESESGGEEGDQGNEEAVDEAEMQEYQAQLDAFHERLNAALRNSSPIVKALKEFVGVLSISDARALYRQFRGSMVLEPLLPALAKKANVKHEPVIVHGHGGSMVVAATVGAADIKKRGASTRTPRAKRGATATTGKRTTKAARPKRPQAPKKKMKKKAAWEAVVPGMSSDEEEDYIEDSDHEEAAAPTPSVTSSLARGRKRAKPESESDEEDVEPTVAASARATGSRTSARRKAPVVTTAAAGTYSDKDHDDDKEQEEGQEEEEDELDPPIKRRKFM